MVQKLLVGTKTDRTISWALLSFLGNERGTSLGYERVSLEKRWRQTSFNFVITAQPTVYFSSSDPDICSWERKLYQESQRNCNEFSVVHVINITRLVTTVICNNLLQGWPTGGSWVTSNPWPYFIRPNDFYWCSELSSGMYCRVK
jgi:hypothetical protein